LWLHGCPRLSLYEPVLRESGQPSNKHRAGPLNQVSIKYILTRREPLKHTTQRATLRIKLHIPLIKLIKKDQVYESAAPSTTNQMQPKVFISKGYKWLGNPYKHTVLKCSMKLYLKVIGCSYYTCLPQSSPTAAQRALKKVAPGTPLAVQCLLMIVMPKHGPHRHIHANNGKR
jgi:hypothetical protein